LEYTEKYCVGCYATVQSARQFLEESTAEYNEPLIDAGGVCSNCGRKGAVIYYKCR